MATRAQMEHEKFLKKMGVRKLTRKESKETRVIANRGKLKDGYASRYYSRDNESKVTPKFVEVERKERDLSTESPEVVREILRKENLIRAINMPRPADLSDDAPERIIDQKHLQSSQIK